MPSGFNAPKVVEKVTRDMANENTPWGDALAPLEREVDGVEKTIWIDLGPVWQGESGSLQLTLRVEPLHWRAHNAERRIVIKKREATDERNGRDERPSGNTGRRGAR